MKYVTTRLADGEGSASQMAIDWLYLCEGAPKKGDVVHGDFGGFPGYMTVVAASTRRAAISNYQGSIKTVRLCGAAERRVMAELDAAWDKVAAAEERASKIQTRLEGFQS